MNHLVLVALVSIMSVCSCKSVDSRKNSTLESTDDETIRVSYGIWTFVFESKKNQGFSFAGLVYDDDWQLVKPETEVIVGHECFPRSKKIELSRDVSNCMNRNGIVREINKVDWILSAETTSKIDPELPYCKTPVVKFHCHKLRDYINQPHGPVLLTNPERFINDWQTQFVGRINPNRN